MPSPDSPAPEPDRYVVIGNPVAHSLSPVIHASFAAQFGDAIDYTTLLAPADGFAGAARAFFDGGGRGANVTLPFKRDAHRFVDSVSERAQLAGAVNVMIARAGRIEGDNTDGAGLVTDLSANLGLQLRGARILLLGAGGAALGVVAPLLALLPAQLAIANRTFARARELAGRFASLGPVRAVALEGTGGGFNLVINATSSSTHGEVLELPAGLFAPGAMAYDMAYGAPARNFLDVALRSGAARASDGLGMLVEQAAQSYWAWRGKKPETAAVISRLRSRR